MPLRPSKPDGVRSAKTEKRERRVFEEIRWGKPVFRPPELPNPQVEPDPLPFPVQSFGNGRSVGGR